MPAPIDPLSTSILVIMYFGDVVFAISDALTAARYRMDILGFVLIGTITGIVGGTTRDLLLGRTRQVDPDAELYPNSRPKSRNSLEWCQIHD
jgi:uncharacterized membrane protein YeiH